MTRWNTGRAEIDTMLKAGNLQRVPASREQANRLLGKARLRLATATLACDSDPDGAYALMYDAARLALTAVLENQGLRPTSKGGHIAAHEAVSAQLVPPLGAVLRPFNGMRKQRNEIEYPPDDAADITPADVREVMPAALAIIDMATQVLDQMSPY
jgi:hypothetical protein